jgi:hypothetical protein
MFHWVVLVHVGCAEPVNMLHLLAHAAPVLQASTVPLLQLFALIAPRASTHLFPAALAALYVPLAPTRVPLVVLGALRVLRGSTVAVALLLVLIAARDTSPINLDRLNALSVLKARLLRQWGSPPALLAE